MKPEGSANLRQSILCIRFEAVEAALKTVHLATGRSGVSPCALGHGLGYGLDGIIGLIFVVQQSQLKPFSHFLKYPSDRSP